MLRARTEASVSAKRAILEDEPLQKTVAGAVDAIIASLRSGGKILFFGNGGSSMDAGHLAAELLGRFYIERASLPAVALSDSTAAMTAIGNDYSYEETFSRQVQGLGRPGDVAFGLTTSGNSANVVRALQVANAKGLVTIVLTGATGGSVVDHADFVLRMPTTDTPRVQECQMLVGHTICEYIEMRLQDDK